MELEYRWSRTFTLVCIPPLYSSIQEDSGSRLQETIIIQKINDKVMLYKLITEIDHFIRFHYYEMKEDWMAIVRMLEDQFNKPFLF